MDFGWALVTGRRNAGSYLYALKFPHELMLGYEPSHVASQFLIADFSRCAVEHGLSPQKFLELRNPMMDPQSRQTLEPFIVTIPG